MTPDHPRKIKGLDGLSAIATLQRADKTSYRRASNVIRIECDNGDRFEAHIAPELYSPGFVDKVLSAFRFNPAWRENFRIFTHEHATTDLVYQTGKIGCVDVRLKPFVQALNDRGFPTLLSCEGDRHPMGRAPHIRFVDAMPEALERVWSTLDWVNLDRTVTPLPIRGHTEAYAQMFFLILDDWLNDDLDETGRRYRIARSPVPPIPEFPPINSHELQEHQRKVGRKAQRLNRKGSQETTFDDLVKLRSGRDSYSSMKLPALLDALDGDPEVAHLQKAIKSIPDLQRALRWRLRGLTLEIILRKYEVDLILSRHAELKKRNALESSLPE